MRGLSRRSFLGRLIVGLAALFSSTVLRQARVSRGQGRKGRQEKAAGQRLSFPNAVGKPPIISRSAWGADERYRFSKGSEVWPREYSTWIKAIVHHTATSNDQDPIVAMRAIYYYHAISLGWGDIGYNYLIDRNGNIYEGRYGGENVQGGHVYGYNKGSLGIAVIGTYAGSGITPMSQRSLISLLGWWSSKWGISPLGSGFFIDKTLPNIIGHRDANPTSCPGDALYAQLPAVRTGVMGQLSGYGEAWVTEKTPLAMPPGGSQRVNVTVRNSGANPWVTGVSNPFRLGYRWYDSSGNPYTAENLEKHTDIPRNVANGEEVTISALLYVPSREGRFILKWDMVQENVTWFVQQGNATLDVPVTLTTVVLGESFSAHNTPSTMIPGYTASVVVDVQNAGTATWSAGGPTPFRLGYHWYDSNGDQIAQPPEDDNRTSLPFDVAPGQRVSLPALATAPRIPDNYTLKWDMVQEGVAWLSTDPANRTLDVAVRVVAMPLQVEPETLTIFVFDTSRPAFGSILIKNPTNGTVYWNAQVTSGSWLSVNAPWGLTPGTVVAIVDTSDMTAGTYEGSISLAGFVGQTQLYARDVQVKVKVSDTVAMAFSDWIEKA